MEIIKNSSLKALNTFGVATKAEYLAKIHNTEDIRDLLEWKQQHKMPNMLLGGGSNLLFINDYHGLVAQVCLKGKQIVDQDDVAYYVKAAGGENWHEFVRWTISQGLAGLENLSLIPGNVGSAPIQNIGAYGVELKDHFYSLDAIDLETGKLICFDSESCKFAYRESYFKSHGLDKLLITSVTFRLPKKPQWKTDYSGIHELLGDQKLTAKRISDAVIQLRRRKLPDPMQIGNAGSFFKNPVLVIEKFKQIKTLHTNFPGYLQKNGDMKTSAAWLIDDCGWKGYRQGDAGISEKHALVLVNYGNASGAQIWQIAQQIIKSVEDRFGITLEPEPRVVG